MPRNNQNKPAPAAKKSTGSKNARNNPVNSTRKTVDTRDHDRFAADKPRDMKSTGPARLALDPPGEIEIIDGPNLKEKQARILFNEDILTVMVHDSTDPNDVPMPEVWNGGVVQRFERGIEQQVRRKYVEVLARAKKTTYTQKLVTDGAGNRSYRNIPHTSPEFPFSVIHDPAGDIGRAWLKKVLSEG